MTNRTAPPSRRDAATQTEPSLTDVRIASAALLPGLPARACARVDGGVFSACGDPAAAASARQAQRQDLANRRRVDAVLERLVAGDGVSPRRDDEHTGEHHCYRWQRGMLEVRTAAAFAAGRDSGFELHLHGSGVMARRDGAWVEQPDPEFFAALDAAARGGRHAFVD